MNFFSSFLWDLRLKIYKKKNPESILFFISYELKTASVYGKKDKLDAGDGFSFLKKGGLQNVQRSISEQRRIQSLILEMRKY